MTRLSCWALGCGIVLALLPFAGRWIAAADSLRILWPVVGAALLCLALLARRAGPALRLAAGAAAVAALLPVGLSALPGRAPEGPVLRLLQHNILYRNDGRQLPRVLEGHDVATLQEVQSLWTALRSLPAPWVGFDCPDAAGIGTAVATRLPVVERGCLADGEAWVRVAAPVGEVTVLSVHLQWPWPAGGARQAQQVNHLAAQISTLPQPVVIGGDFNQMPWSASVRRIAAAAGGHVSGGLRATYVRAGGLIRLPIDHVIVPEGWAADTLKGPRHLSDHNSVTAMIGQTS